MIKRENGISLIEVLITLLIVSITLAGSVGIAIISTKLTNRTIQLSDLMNITNNFHNLILINKRELILENSHYLHMFTSESKLIDSCLGSIGCESHSQAIVDLKKWQTDLTHLLVNYSVVICRDKTPNDGYYKGSNGCDNLSTSEMSVKVWWVVPENSINKAEFYYRSITL